MFHQLCMYWEWKYLFIYFGQKGRYTKFCSNNWTKLRNLCRVKLNKNDQDLSQFWTIIKISCLFFMVLIFCIPQLNFMLLCIKWPIEQNYIAQLEQGCFCYQFKKKLVLTLDQGHEQGEEKKIVFYCVEKWKVHLNILSPFIEAFGKSPSSAIT